MPTRPRFLAKAAHGFTLIEFLVVIAILTVLSALLLPAIIRANSNAQKARCAANLRQLGIGLQNFVSDNHAYPSAVSGTNTDNAGTWMAQLQRGGFVATGLRSNFWAEGVWRCPSARLRTSGHDRSAGLSYGYNVFGVATGDRTNSLGLLGRLVSASELFVPLVESEVVAPSEMIALGESSNGRPFFTRTSPGASRHRGWINVTFCDGHVESLTSHALFEDTNAPALARWNRDHQPHHDRLPLTGRR